MRNTFSKQQRLKSRKKLQEVFARGKRFFSGDVKLLFLIEDGDVAVKCGVGLSGRNFKKAVDRNRIKRLLREAYRLQQHPVNSFAQISNKQVSLFLMYGGKEIPAYQYVYENTELVLQKFLKHCHAAGVENT